MTMRIVKDRGIELGCNTIANYRDNPGDRRLQLIQGLPDEEGSIISIGEDALMNLRDLLNEIFEMDRIEVGKVQTNSDLLLIVDPSKLCENPLNDKEHISITQVVGDMKIRDGMVVKMGHRGNHEIIAHSDDGRIKEIRIIFEKKEHRKIVRGVRPPPA